MLAGTGAVEIFELAQHCTLGSTATGKLVTGALLTWLDIETSTRWIC